MWLSIHMISTNLVGYVNFHLAEGAPNNTIVTWNTKATHEVKTAALPNL